VRRISKSPYAPRNGDAKVPADVEIAPARDKQQAPERELHALLVAGSNQESRVSGANRV
jgi:hypothetical protein